MAEDYNLEEEYGWFVDGVLAYVENNPDEFLAHYGVKGMKWGKRKEGSTKTELKSLGPDKIVRKTANGDTLTLTKNPPTVVHKALAKMSPNYRENYAKFASMSISDSSGKKIGSAQVHKENDEELNLVWLGIDKSARGQGYATAAMKTAEEFGRQSGFKKLTLEVPGDSPDARHIYEKLGFKVTKEADPADQDDVWGGLTMMEYAFDKAKHSDSTEAFFAHYGVKGMKWGKRKGESKSSGVVKETASEDAARVGSIHTRVATQKSTKMLSNKELQAAIERMRLEQQYSQMTGGLDKTFKQKASAFIRETAETLVKGTIKDQATANVKDIIEKQTKTGKHEPVAVARREAEIASARARTRQANAS